MDRTRARVRVCMCMYVRARVRGTEPLKCPRGRVGWVPPLNRCASASLCSRFIYLFFSSSPSLLPFSEAHRLRVHVPGKSARAMHQLMHVWLVPLLHDPAARRCFLSRYVGCLKCKERARERQGDREREGVFFAPCARCAHEGKCG